MEKNRLEKVRKHVFYKHTNIVIKKWGKNARKIFSRNTRIPRAKNDGKKSSGKSAKTRFLQTHKYRDQKMGGKNARKFFSRNPRISRTKKMEKNLLEKVRKHVFYKHTNIVTIKWGEKNARKIFPKTHE